MSAARFSRVIFAIAEIISCKDFANGAHGAGRTVDVDPFAVLRMGGKTFSKTASRKKDGFP